MLTNPTVDKLREMKMSVMANKFVEQLTAPEYAGLSFEERFGFIVDAEWATRKSNRLTRLIKSAGYACPGASLEDIEYHPDRGLDKALITRLGTCAYVQEHRNVIILGATGSGKTYLSNALGMRANREFMSVKYIRLPDLLAELAIKKPREKRRRGFMRRFCRAFCGKNFEPAPKVVIVRFSRPIGKSAY